MGTTEVVKTNGVALGTTQREDFGGREIERVAETAATAVAAREKAATEARYILAMRNPRDWEMVRVRLIKECKRPGFAKSAWYKIPNRGEGWTIRFAEAALRCMTNVYPEVATVFDDSERIIFRVCLTDLEANLTYATEVTVRKTVERQKVNPGDVVVGERMNSFGKKVYIREATDDEMLVKQNALISKAIRTNGLRLLPGDISDECKSLVFATLRGDINEDPDAAKRQIIDAFTEIGVTPADLQMYLGHSLERFQPAELVDLRGIYTAIKSEGATWGSVMEEKNPSGSVEAAQAVAAEKLKVMHAEEEARKKRHTQSDDIGGGSSPVKVATESGSGETVNREAPERREIPPASTHGPKTYEDFPDAFEFSKGHQIIVKGVLYAANDELTGWNNLGAVAPAKPQTGFAFGKGKK